MWVKVVASGESPLTLFLRSKKGTQLSMIEVQTDRLFKVDWAFSKENTVSKSIGYRSPCNGVTTLYMNILFLHHSYVIINGGIAPRLSKVSPLS